MRPVLNIYAPLPATIYETVIEESGEETEGGFTNFPHALCALTGSRKYRFSLGLIYRHKELKSNQRREKI